MRHRKLLASVFMAFATTALNTHADDALKADLQRVTSLRIFFGHQSVGDNMLDGVRDLARSEGIRLKVEEVRSAEEVAAGTLGHSRLAENGNPWKKMALFAHALDAKQAHVDIALMKVCYVDFNSETDGKALFARYQATIDALRVRHPGTVFIHVTAPLTTVQTGPKAFIKRLLGRAPYGILENARREEYNALLRQTYAGREPIFDLAALESTDFQGNRVTAEWEGKVIPAMAPAFTSDGGHLNEAGRLRAARELIRTLASAKSRRSSVVADNR